MLLLDLDATSLLSGEKATANTQAELINKPRLILVVAF